MAADGTAAVSDSQEFGRLPREVPLPSTGAGQFPLIDELRAVAALVVLVGHLDLIALRSDPARGKTLLEQLFIPNALGVPLFFVLSGFLLFGQFARAAHRGEVLDAKRFWRNRALRILPCYWTALVVLAIFPGLPQLDAKSLPFNVLLLQAWVPGYTKSGIGPAWTLCAEAAFYALLPLFAVWLWRFARTRTMSAERLLKVQLGAAGLIWAGSIAFDLAIAGGRVEKVSYLQEALPGVMHWFALGMALASVYAYRQATNRVSTRDHTMYWWLSALALNLAIALAFREPSGVSGVAFVALEGLVAFCVMAPLAQVRDRPSRAERGAARVPGLAWLGLISFGIYIWQLPILEKLGSATLQDHGTANVLLFCAVSIAAVIGVATLSYYYVEAPALRLKDRTSFRLGPRRPDDPTAPAAEDHAAP